ncbi:MAG: hypothetical protein CBB69_002885, partial [Phycisphaera sp. TMED9]
MRLDLSHPRLATTTGQHHHLGGAMHAKRKPASGPHGDEQRARVAVIEACTVTMRHREIHAGEFRCRDLPAMGVAGTAVAAGISFAVGSAILLTLWVKQKFRVRHVSGGWWRRERLRKLIHIGYPAALEQGVFQLGFFVFLILIGHNYGTEAFAAYNIGVNILAVCMTVGFGFSIAGSTLVGQHLGAGDFAGAARSGWRSMWLAIGSMGSIGLVVVLFAENLATYFIGSGDLTIRYTVDFIYILGTMMPLLA